MNEYITLIIMITIDTSIHTLTARRQSPTGYVMYIILYVSYRVCIQSKYNR